MEELETRIEKLEDTLLYIRWMWNNTYMRLLIDRALVGNYDLMEDE